MNDTDTDTTWESIVSSAVDILLDSVPTDAERASARWEAAEAYEEWDDAYLCNARQGSFDNGFRSSAKLRSASAVWRADSVKLRCFDERLTGDADVER
jgi:hypothetical protein